MLSDMQEAAKKAAAMMSDAKMGVASSSKPEPPPAKDADNTLNGLDASQIPHDDLLHLTMKLSKRLRATDATTGRLKTAYKETAARKEALLRFVLDDVLAGALQPDGEPEVDALRQTWAARQQSELARAQQELGAARASHARETASLRDQLLELRSQTNGDAAGATTGGDALRQEVQRLSGELQNARREAEQLRPALSEAQSLVTARDATLEGLRGQLDAAQGKAAELAAKEDELRAAKASHEEQLVFVSLQLENAKRSEVRATAPLSRARSRGRSRAAAPPVGTSLQRTERLYPAHRCRRPAPLCLKGRGTRCAREHGSPSWRGGAVARARAGA